MENMIGKEILNYRIEQELGQGGMGSVYLATNKNIDQKVAIKALNANLAGSVVIRKKFRDEAQLLCSLDHPNIVKFLNFVENDDGVFLIMELIDGITLEDFINNKNGLIVESRAYEMFDQILNAFAYAHKKGVVHRDIKPANIILTNDGDGNFVPKVLDFGIATIVSESSETEKGWVVGTPAYMSPEQVLGTKVDSRSDIYSLGVLLHQMLTGRAPYDTTTLSELEINNKVVKDPLPRMKEFYPHISDKMQKMVDKATAKAPDQRFQSCNDFRKILKNTLNPDPVKRGIKIAAAALVLLLLGGGLWYWDTHRIKTYYYKDYVEQWGVPKGIHKLSASEFHHRQASYRFVYKEKKLQSLALVNSKGNIQNWNAVDDSSQDRFDRPVNATFSYRSSGNIDYVLYLDRSGKTLLKKSYNEGKDGKINLFIFQYNDEYGTEKKLPKDMTGYIKLENEYAERGAISRFALTFDEQGFLSAIHYRNADQAVGDGEHIYGKRYERDEKGRVVKEYLLAHDDSVRATSWGLAVKQFEYDAEDNWVKAVYLAPDGSPSYDSKGGISVHVMEYDQKQGNLTYSWFQDSDGNLTLPKIYGAAGFMYEYNNDGQVILQFTLGTDKNPMYSAAGHIGTQDEYDAYGYISKRMYIDENKQPAVAKDGSTIVINKNDTNGNALEKQYFDIDNQPCEIPAGYSKIVWERDNLGNPLSAFYYDANDSLCLLNTGVAGWSHEYNDQNKLTKTINYGTDKQPHEDKNGVIVQEYEYDSKGNEIKNASYESDGKTLKLNNNGIAGVRLEYDNGKIIKTEYFDEKEQPTEGYYDHAKWEAAYDDMGNQTEISYFDKNGVFIRGTKNTYDGRGNLVERFPIGKDKNLAQGYLIARYKYDEHDNRIEVAYYNANNQLRITTNEYAKITYAFDDRNQEIERRYYNENGKLFVNPEEGYAIQKSEYDNRGNNITISYFGVSEKSVKGKHGYATRIMEWNALGGMIRSTYFDEQGSFTKPEVLAPEDLYGYDKWGNQNYQATADGFGNKINDPIKGYAIIRWDFDIRGNRISESYYDKDDKPCVNEQRSVHKLVWAYDKHNRWIEFSCYDINNKPCVDKNNDIHKIVRAYDERGNKTEERYYDASVSLRKDDYAIEKYKYDERNRQVERALYNYLDRSTNNNIGWHRIVSSYSESEVRYDIDYAVNGSIVSEWMYDPKADQLTRTDGWRRWWENSRASLPVRLDDYTQVTAISLSGNTCTVTLRINFSKYDLSGTDIVTLEDDAKEYGKLWREDSKMPRYGALVLLGMDNADRELYRISY
ncbi:serine/threonine protein kinase [Spirochaetia bacterium]|nr:serine/threonine protein kinase [Spirochaetia bacterium]